MLVYIPIAPLELCKTDNDIRAMDSIRKFETEMSGVKTLVEECGENCGEDGGIVSTIEQIFQEMFAEAAALSSGHANTFARFEIASLTLDRLYEKFHQKISVDQNRSVRIATLDVEIEYAAFKLLKRQGKVSSEDCKHYLQVVSATVDCVERLGGADVVKGLAFEKCESFVAEISTVV